MTRTPPTRPQHVGLPWVAFAAMVAYEVWAVACRQEQGGPLTHHVRWAYGTPGSVRWWVVGGAGTGLLTWAAPHFLFPGYNRRHFRRHLIAGVGIGALGAIADRHRKPGTTTPDLVV